VEIHWAMLPLVLTGVAVTIGGFRSDRAKQPPPVGREFYRPHWEWERNDPVGRRLRAARGWITSLIAASVTLVFLLAFFGVGLPFG
jgi:hypothetical protein